MQKRVPLKLPIANIFNVAARSLALTAIGGYQKFISPHKGFSCAHRVLYGCESCSQYFKQVIAEEGIFTAISNAKGRFQECREANEILKARRAKCRARKKYSASRLIPSTLAIESGDLESQDLPENPENPEETENPETSNKNRLGGSQWARRRRSQAKNDNNDSNGGVNNNCNNCDSCSDGIIDIPCDCLSDSLGNCNNPLEGVNCPDLSCPDLNCGNADCLSGMDCSGLDCGDCGNVGDCGDCGSCG